ncbi:MAG: asparaginyl/glutamyl-tRNA amidotransferase subunit C [SAR202 cluster bacterium Io17-Chloro-G9]|nr:MAG: asparaginyl/glutamyl-tRNA amidotransferase subunit C [SAR202 cluster bacterium Io17-Chloro-G9]
MPLDRNDVEHIATLARIGLTQEELERFQEQLSHILEQFQILNEVDTTGVSATGHAAGIGEEVEGSGVMREDVSGDSATPEDVLSNAPRREGEFFRVKAVLEE